MSAPILKSDFSDMTWLKSVWRVFVLKVLSFFLTVGVIKVITWNFGGDGLGMFSIYLSALGVVGLFSTFGFGNAALKLSASNYKDEAGVLRQDHWSMVGLSGVIALILVPLLWILSEPLGVWFLDVEGLDMGVEEKGMVFKLVALALVPYVLLEVNAEFVRGVGHSFSYMIFKDSGVWVVMVGFMAWFILSGSNEMAPIWAHLIGLTLFSGLCVLVVMKLLQRGGYGVGGHGLGALLKLSMPMLFSKGMILLGPHLTILTVGYFMTTDDAGGYTVAYHLSGRVVSVVSFCMNVVIAPGIAYHYKKGEFKELEDLTKNSVRIAVWLSIPVVLVLIGGGEYFLGFFEEGFAEAWSVLVILVLADFLDVVFGPVGYLLTMTGKEKVFGKVTFVCTLFKLILLVSLIPVFGLMGAAWAYFGYTVAWNLGALYFIKGHLGFCPAYIPFVRR